MTVPISVIMPAYNSASLIQHSLLSVAAQTLKTFELIVVDDGSVDGTAETAERILRDFGGNVNYHVSRNRENYGESHARNVGIRLSRGDYLFFLDSDDLIEPECLATLHAMAMRQKADITVCRYDRVVVRDGSIRAVQKHLTYYDRLPTLLSGHEALRLNLSGRFGLWVSSMLYSSNLIERHNIRFTEGIRYGADRQFQIKALHYANTVAYIPIVLSHYVQRANSVMGSGSKDVAFFFNIEWIISAKEFLINRNAPIGMLRSILYNVIPKTTSARMSRLMTDHPSYSKISDTLSLMARKYPYRLNSMSISDIYYWIDSRIIAYCPSGYDIWKKICKRIINVLFR